MDTERIGSTELARVPVLPLPGTVLFPGTVLPLQVSDATHCRMITDVVESGGLLAVVMTKTGSDAAEVHEVATAGRLIHAEKQDGHFDILVQGLSRVRLVEELPRKQEYRCFRAELIPQPCEATLERASRALARLHSCVLSLRSSMQEKDAQLVEVLSSTNDPVQLADILCAAVVSDPNCQQFLLAAPLAERLDTLVDVLAEVMVNKGAPPRSAMMN